ncbi:hypothetical protein RF11_05422 [Thelohanellus kitauei]|uniref:Uncharacterized protein n=1 Tax=Thelohanellus kitauei TaxID=669202 RepID=A0A0C2J8D9_THEKT|nr:hypothetical protein RF11_05422 [Thelohanellus kitauei]
MTVRGSSLTRGWAVSFDHHLCILMLQKSAYSSSSDSIEPALFLTNLPDNLYFEAVLGFLEHANRIIAMAVLVLSHEMRVGQAIIQLTTVSSKSENDLTPDQACSYRIIDIRIIISTSMNATRQFAQLQAMPVALWPPMNTELLWKLPLNAWQISQTSPSLDCRVVDMNSGSFCYTTTAYFTLVPTALFEGILESRRYLNLITALVPVICACQPGYENVTGRKNGCENLSEYDSRKINSYYSHAMPLRSYMSKFSIYFFHFGLPNPICLYLCLEYYTKVQLTFIGKQHEVAPSVNARFCGPVAKEGGSRSFTESKGRYKSHVERKPATGLMSTVPKLTQPRANKSLLQPTKPF